MITINEAESLPVENWNTTINSWKTAPAGSAERFAFYIGCSMVTYADQEERNRAITIKLARNWKAKHDRGETSCAWHEISEHAGKLDRCPCAKCEEKRRGALA